MRPTVLQKFGTLLLLIALSSILSGCSDKTYAKSDSPLIELNDLPQLAKQSKQNQLPILLLFSAQWCEYCQLLKEEVLEPMMLNGLYENKWLYIRHVGIDQSKPMIDLNGNDIKKAKWAYQLNADLTPTVIFIDHQGNEVADRITGISEITLYASLIHARLNQAYQKMGLDKRIPPTPELLDKQTNQTP